MHLQVAHKPAKDLLFLFLLLNLHSPPPNPKTLLTNSQLPSTQISQKFPKRFIKKAPLFSFSALNPPQIFLLVSIPEPRVVEFQLCKGRKFVKEKKLSP